MKVGVGTMTQRSSPEDGHPPKGAGHADEQDTQMSKTKARPPGERVTEPVSVTRVRATPYDMVILWSEPGLSIQSMDSLTDLAEGLAESTDCVAVAIVPSDVLTNVTAHGLDSLLRLRAHLDDCIEVMTNEHPGCGDA